MLYLIFKINSIQKHNLRVLLNISLLSLMHVLQEVLQSAQVKIVSE